MSTVVTVSSFTTVVMILFLSSLSLNQSEAQISLPACHDGYQRNSLGLCEPIKLTPNLQSCPMGYQQLPPGFCVPVVDSSLPLNNVTNQTQNQESSPLVQQQTNTSVVKQFLQPSHPPLQQQPLQQQPQQNQLPAPSYPPPLTQQQWITYEDPVNRIRIQIPSNWQIVSGQSNKLVEFKLPSITKPSFGSGPALDADLSISLQNIGTYLDTKTLQVKGATLEDYVAAKKNEINSLSFPTGNLDFRLEYLKDYQTTIGGNPAWKIEYMSYLSGRQGLYNIETYVMKDSILYTLKFFSDPLKVPETLPIAQQVIDSFQIVG